MRKKISIYFATFLLILLLVEIKADDDEKTCKNDGIGYNK